MFDPIRIQRIRRIMCMGQKVQTKFTPVPPLSRKHRIADGKFPGHGFLKRLHKLRCSSTCANRRKLQKRFTVCSTETRGISNRTKNKKRQTKTGATTTTTTTTTKTTSRNWFQTEASRRFDVRKQRARLASGTLPAGASA